MNGYLAASYAASLMYYGRPIQLQGSGSWGLERKIDNSSYVDMSGCYPLMACRNWQGIASDLEDLDSTCVSFTMVTDPLGAFDPDVLRVEFPDLFRPFKHHYLVQLQEGFGQNIATNHKRNAKRALKSLTIGREQNPLDILEPWTQMYSNLIDRHQISGVSAFSRKSFEIQLETPGMVVYSAKMNGELLGLVLFYETGGHMYYHLGAYLDEGYARKASFGIFQVAIRDFSAEGFEYLNMGGGAGVQENADDGLTRFKRGWASESRPAYLCGKILNQDAYRHLVNRHISSGNLNGFFPAYRSGV
ncbi:MAG: GNAT family N-acetyltransferase [Rhodothermales bacterium]